MKLKGRGKLKGEATIHVQKINTVEMESRGKWHERQRYRYGRQEMIQGKDGELTHRKGGEKQAKLTE